VWPKWFWRCINYVCICKPRNLRNKKVWRRGGGRRRKTTHFWPFWHRFKMAATWLYATLLISVCLLCRLQQPDVNIFVTALVTLPLLCVRECNSKSQLALLYSTFHSHTASHCFACIYSHWQIPTDSLPYSQWLTNSVFWYICVSEPELSAQTLIAKPNKVRNRALSIGFAGS